MRRAIYADFPVLIVSIVLTVIAIALRITSPYFFIIFAYVFGILAISNTLLVVFGLLGAKASGSPFHWWIFGAVILAFLAFATLVIDNIPCTTSPAEKVL